MKKKKKKRILTVVLVIVCVAAGAGGAAAFDYFADLKNVTPSEELEVARQTEAVVPVDEIIAPSEVYLTEETIDEVFAKSKELVAMTYYYTNAADMEKYRNFVPTDSKIWGTTDKVVFTYEGEIKVGINLSEIEYDEINNEEKIIKITLPYPKKISHEIDMESFEWYDIKNSIFTSFTPQDTTDQLNVLKKKQELKLQNNEEFYDSVKENTKSILQDLITLNEETKEYTIEFNFKEPENQLTEDEVEQEENALPVNSKNISIPKGAKKYVGENYVDVFTALRDAGFIEIEVIPLADLKMGVIAKDGTIESISINGNDDFTKGDYFPFDATIRIKYHSY